MERSVKQDHRAMLFTIFFTVFIDLLGLGLVIPIFAPLLLDGHIALLSASAPIATRAILLGCLIAAYPLAQFFGAPMLGGWADRHGRKNVLIFALMGTLFGYLIFSLGIVTHNIGLLFLGRLIDGFSGGNVSIALSSIADMSTEMEKAKNFGIAGIGVGLGFILGPVIGGKLTDPSIVSWFSYVTPFVFAAVLSAINIMLVAWRFKETLRERVESPIDLWTGARNIKKAFGYTNLRVIFIVIFLLHFGFNFFVQFFSVFLIDKFTVTQSQIGDFFAYGGLWIAISQGVLTPILARFFSNRQILAWSTLGLAIFLPVLLVPEKLWLLYIVLPFVAIFEGLTQPTSTAIVSSLSDKDSQGEILGISQSIQSLAQAIPPIIAGIIVAIKISLPIVVAGIATLAAWLIFIFFYKAVREEKFSEV